jgi:hypothetical protein
VLFSNSKADLHHRLILSHDNGFQRMSGQYAPRFVPMFSPDQFKLSGDYYAIRIPYLGIERTLTVAPGY